MGLWRDDALRFGADYYPEQWPVEVWVPVTTIPAGGVVVLREAHDHRG